MSLINRPIHSLGSRTLANAVSYRRTGVLYEYSLGDVGLLAATSQQFPYSRQTADFRKDQFDASSAPGEQSLSSWWLRSQSSFHQGAGIKFMEPTTDPVIAAQFAASAGVDVWTPGQATLLKDTSLKAAAGGDVLLSGAIDGTTDIYLNASGSTLTRETSAGSTTVTWGGTGTILALANDGANYYAANATSIYKGTLAGGAGSAIWNTGNSNVVIGWAKQRLVAGIGPSIYELVSGGPTLPTPAYTHPSSAWKWTAIAEGPSAIFAAGYSGAESAIFKFVLATSGAMPTLSQGIVAAKLPYGEQVVSLFAYLGTFIAIGTTKGVRIGEIDTNGDISYGPLVIQSTAPVYGLVGKDRYVFATCTNQIDGVSGLWRIDLGGQRDDGTFPYATDLSAKVTGTVNSVCLLGASGRLVIGVSGLGSYIESATTLVAQGYLRTGFIRFDTFEPKAFRYVTGRVASQLGSVAVSTYDRDGAVSSVATIQGRDDSDFDMGRTTGEEFIALQFTLNRDTDTTQGPTLTGWQVKALPAVNRSRIIQVPVLLFEEMRDSKGAKLPVIDIWDVLSSLEDIEEAAAPVLFSNLLHKPTRNELVVIEQIRFQETSPPPRCSGEGGILYLQLRTVL